MTSTMPQPPNGQYGQVGDTGTGQSGTPAGRVFAYVAGFVALVAIGATLGWNLTNIHPSSASAAGLPPVSNSASPAPSTSTPGHGSSSASTPSTNGEFVIPDYAARGWTFLQARDDLRSHAIQGDPVFVGSGNSETVDRTSPAAGHAISRGVTVKIYVNGAAPALAVPPVPANTSCQDYAHQLVNMGFKIAGYHGKRTDAVTAESPDQNDPSTHWNSLITLTCGNHNNPPPTQSPSPPPTTPPPSASPSPGR